MARLITRMAGTGVLLAALCTLLALAHTLLAALYTVDRAVPAIQPTMLRQIVPLVDGWWWITIHTISACLLLAASIIDHWRLGIWAAATSTTAWATWALLVGLWSWHTIPPVSLTAPALAAVLALTSALACAAWSERDM